MNIKVLQDYIRLEYDELETKYSESELDEILELITDGLEHFRIKNECIGATVDVYARTT